MYKANSQKRDTTDFGRQRQGAAIIVVIAFYAVAIAMCGVWIRTSLSCQRQVRLSYEKVQATWLADAGVRRAVARLVNDAKYVGEHWEIAAAQLGGNHDAVVEIRIEAVNPPDGSEELSNQDADRVQLVATAELPAGQQRHVRFTKSAEVKLSILMLDLQGDSL